MFAVAVGLLAVGIVVREWAGILQTVPAIHLEARFLPLYTLLSLSRGVMAYGISLLFTLVYGYAMARVSGADRVMLPLLDILQSIPVLGFLPGFVLGLVHLFPNRNIGLELASILMIFTGQVWNMTFSFYSSLKSVPPDLRSVARLARLSWWRRFFVLELSFSATGLLWNSMMSMAGGWFFLMVSEAFVLGEHDFRLPGLGSYMSLAIEKGDAGAQWLGILSMLAMIVALDRVIWRPLVAWSHKFTDEENISNRPTWIGNAVRSSWTCQALTQLNLRLTRLHVTQQRSQPARTQGPLVGLAQSTAARQNAKRAVLTILGLAFLWALVRYVLLLVRLPAQQWIELLGSTAATFFRVATAVLLASCWTIPVGVLIGRNPRWSRVLQPVIQMAASFPAPMIFPVVVGLMLAGGIGLGLSSVVLLQLGTQWYILFNVIAGSGAIPKPLWEVARLSRFSWRARWCRLILPAIFPSLLTGWITAMGGAWNASIVAEYMNYRGTTLSTTGLGSAISAATEHGDFPRLGAAVGLMGLTVVAFNRLCWRPLGRWAQIRFTIDT